MRMVGQEMTHPGVELTVTMDGEPVFSGDSDFLHDWCKYAAYSATGEWLTVAAWPTCRGILRMELRAAQLADVPPPDVPDDAAALFAAAAVNASAAAPGPGGNGGATVPVDAELTRGSRTGRRALLARFLSGRSAGPWGPRRHAAGRHR